jgi:LmbE family N-acetylglucosaminyl deacetylase
VNRSRFVVLSPHLDDAVLGCGQGLHAHPGAIVVTVFAGRPPAGTELTPWDSDAGFRHGDDPIGTRRAEDSAALQLLRARALWLEFRDAQYGGTESPVDLAAVLVPLLSEIADDRVLAPLGLFHSDHERTREAALEARGRIENSLRWYLYADGLYAAQPHAVRATLAALRARGERLRRVRWRRAGSCQAKRRAIACYASQLRALATPGRPDVASAFHPERFWRLGV